MFIAPLFVCGNVFSENSYPRGNAICPSAKASSILHNLTKGGWYVFEQ